jgi:hypothetical protein
MWSIRRVRWSREQGHGLVVNRKSSMLEVGLTVLLHRHVHEKTFKRQYPAWHPTVEGPTGVRRPVVRPFDQEDPHWLA